MKLTAWYINKFNNINTDQLLIYLYIMVIALDMHLEKVKYMHINLPITNVYCFFQNMYISKLYNSAWTEADSKTDSSILTCVVHFQVVWCSTNWNWQQNNPASTLFLPVWTNQNPHTKQSYHAIKCYLIVQWVKLKGTLMGGFF